MNLISFLQINNMIFIIATTLLGLIVGSFLNVVIYRLPIMLREETENTVEDGLKNKILKKINGFNIVTPRSHCPECKNQILWWQNVPLVSYIALKGKCHYCKKPIYWRYPVVEILTALTTLIVAINFGINTQTIPMLILTWALIALVFIDLETQLLPDQITLPLLWLGLLINTKYTFASPQNAIIGAIAGYLFLWIIAKIFKMVRNIEGMGYGDFKLFAVLGAWLGWQLLPLIILAASLSGLIAGLFLIVFKKHRIDKPIPFGPYLATTGWLAFFWGQTVINWYNQYLLI